MAQLRYTEDGKSFVFVVDDDNEFEPCEVPKEGCMVFDDEDTGRMFYVVLNNYPEDDLEPDTVYELKELDTEVMQGDEELEDEEEEEEQETIG